MADPSDALGRRFVVAGALVAGVSVAAGAFGAHALRDLVTPARLGTFETGVRYALVHGLALFGLGVLGFVRPDLGNVLRPVGMLWLAGTLVFAGSLWALVLLDLPVLGAVTPFGGLGLIGGWCLLAWRMGRRA